MDNNYNNNDNNYNNSYNNQNSNNDFYQQPKESYHNPYEDNNYNNNNNFNNNYNNTGEPSEGTTALILGILSIVLCCGFPTPIVLGIIAIINANKCRTIMGGVDTSKSATGRTCAIIGIVLSVLAGLLYIAYYLFAFIAAFSSF